LRVLRRVEMVVARAAPPEEVFAAVAAEVGRLLSADVTVLARYDWGGGVTVLGAWSGTGASVPVPDTRASLSGLDTATLVFRTRRSARIDDNADTSGAPDDIARGRGCARPSAFRSVSRAGSGASGFAA
jgi:hypothetical protein